MKNNFVFILTVLPLILMFKPMLFLLQINDDNFFVNPTAETNFLKNISSNFNLVFFHDYTVFYLSFVQASNSTHYELF